MWIAALDPADRRRIEPHLHERPFEQGQMLYDAGEAVEEVWFPMSGVVSLMTILDDDRMIETAAIGRRYRRQDEIGTPYGITIDFETIEKGAGVTVRDRDTLEQVRMTEDEVVRFLDDKVNG